MFFISIINDLCFSLNPERPGDLKECYNVNGFGLCSNEAKWPNDLVPEFEDIMNKFVGKCKTLSHRILKCIAVGLHLEVGIKLKYCT